MSKSFRCERCDRAFADNTHLKRHLNRKTPCAPVIDAEDLTEEQKSNPNKCKFCGRTFSTYVSMRRHIRQSCQIAPRAGNPDGMEKLYDHVLKKQQKEIEVLTARLDAAGIGDGKQTNTSAIKEAKTTIALKQATIAAPPQSDEHTPLFAQSNSSKNIAVAQAGGVAVNDNRQQHITINIFGREKFDHIHSPQIMSLLEAVGAAGSTAVEDLKKAAALAVVRAAMLIFSDPAHPENLTCYLPNKRGTDALVHGEGGWEVQPVSLVLSPMATQAVELLFAKQPYPGIDGVADMAKIDECGRILRYIAAHEKDLRNDPPRNEMRGVLIRNKDLLQQVLAKLPIASRINATVPAVTVEAIPPVTAAEEDSMDVGNENTLTVSDIVDAMKQAPPPADLGDSSADAICSAYAAKIFRAVMISKRPRAGNGDLADFCDRIDAKLWDMSTEESVPEKFQVAARSISSYYAENAAVVQAGLSH
jgi:hypothetical protein